MYEDDEGEGTDELESLFESIQEGKREQVKQWFEKYKVDDFSYDQWSPVHEAAEHGQIEILWDLLHLYGFGADDDIELEPYYDEIYGTGREIQETFQFYRGSALTIALSHGYFAMAELLIRQGAWVNETFYIEGGDDYDDIALAFGANLRVTEGNCLSLALIKNADPIVELMKDYNLDVDSRWEVSGDEDNVFGVYLRKGDKKRIAQLLAMGADANQNILVPDNDECYERNALFFAIDCYLDSSIQQEAWFSIIDSLLKHGARLDVLEDYSDNETILHKVLESGDKILIRRFGLDQIAELAIT